MRDIEAHANPRRTHRERKEMYIKALEQEVLRLKDVFAQTARERDAVAAENGRLRELLAQHGISYDFGENPVKFQHSASAYGPSSSGSISGSYADPSDSASFSPPAPPPNGLPLAMPNDQMQPPPSGGLGSMQPHRQHAGQLPNNRLDYDQIGVDFVLTYDSQGRPTQVPAPYPSPPSQQKS